MLQTQRGDNRLDLSILNKLSLDLTNVVKSLKLAYHRQIVVKLNNPKPYSKTCWSILKSFVNGKEIPFVNNQHVTNFLIKVNLLNEFFLDNNIIPLITTALFLVV